MLVLHVTVDVKPEKVQEFLDVVKYDAEHSEKDEPGCMRFDVLQDKENPLRYYFYEVYRDEAALQAHRKAPHFQLWAQKNPELLSGPIERRLATNVVPSDATWR